MGATQTEKAAKAAKAAKAEQGVLSPAQARMKAVVKAAEAAKAR